MTQAYDIIEHEYDVVLNGPTYAHEILTTAELISALQAGPAAAG